MHMKKYIYIYIYIFFKKQQKYFSRKIYLFIFITYVLNAPKINGLYMKKKNPNIKVFGKSRGPVFCLQLHQFALNKM